jgi:hypothetical protein
MSGSYLTRDAILQAPDLPGEDVAVPEWGGTVRVRGLSGAQRDAYEASMVIMPQSPGGKPKMNMENARAKLVAMCIVDENGSPLFTLADVEALGRKSGSALNRVYEVAQRLSGLTKADMEEIEKN